MTPRVLNESSLSFLDFVTLNVLWRGRNVDYMWLGIEIVRISTVPYYIPYSDHRR